ncbi:MAG: LysM peptidoglycan-binding domain-containing protein [Bacteroidales bacterium]
MLFIKKLLHFSVLCLLSFTVFAQKTAPISKGFTYSTVHSYSAKGKELVEPMTPSGKVLTEEQEETLWNGLQETEHFHNPSRCIFHPHDSFYFYDEEGEAVAKVIVCFECGDVMFDFYIPAVADKSNLSSQKQMFVGMTAAGRKFFRSLLEEVNGEEANTYIVKTGDYLYKIAKEYGTTIEVLMEINGLENDRLDIGQILILPSE